MPPDVAIAGADGILVVGELGSYTYCGTSADALPPKAENVEAVTLTAATVDVIVEGDQSVAAYRTAYWPASDWPGDEIALDQVTLSSPANQLSIGGPPPGDWMLALHITFASGDASTYYWHVTAS